MANSPTQRSLKKLRQLGYTSCITEKWNAFARVRMDLFGFIDVVGIHPDRQGVLGIQTTSTGNISARVKKILALPAARLWLLCGNAIQVWGWAKRGGRGQRKVWTLKRVKLTKKELNNHVDMQV